MRNEEEFFAWLDGELHGEAAERVAVEVAADPELQRLAQQHRALGAGLRGAFDPVAAEPLPDVLRTAVRPGAAVVDLGAARAARERRAGSPMWRQAAAMAATLVLGLVIGNSLSGNPPAAVEIEGGRLIASGDLERALQVRLASAPVDEGAKIGLTFRDKSGAICRTFDDEGASGLACRHEGDWLIRGLFNASEGQQGDYRMAAGNDPQLAALVDEAMAGEPFDAAQENAAKERGWR